MGATAFVLGHPLASLINKTNQGSVTLDFSESLFSSIFFGSIITRWFNLSLLQLVTYSLLHLGVALTSVLLLEILGLRFALIRSLPLGIPTLNDGWAVSNVPYSLGNVELYGSSGGVLVMNSLLSIPIKVLIVRTIYRNFVPLILGSK